MNVETKTLPIQGPGVFAIQDIPCSALVLAIDDTRVIAAVFTLRDHR